MVVNSGFDKRAFKGIQHVQNIRWLIQIGRNNMSAIDVKSDFNVLVVVDEDGEPSYERRCVIDEERKSLALIDT